MRKFNEYDVEKKMLQLLEENGWETYGDPENDEWGAKILDERYDRKPSEVVYWNLLREKILAINDHVSESEAKEVISKLKRQLGGENLVEANEQFQEKLRKGVEHTIMRDGENESTYVQLIDTPETEVEIDRSELSKNSFQAVNQFAVERPDQSRPDVTLLVNGIPIVHVELKSGVGESTWESARNDLLNYEERTPRMFATSILNVASSGHFFRYAPVGADKDSYFPWRSESYEDEDLEMEDATADLLNPETLTDILKFYSFYHSGNKIVPRYMQYQAANKALKRIRNGEPRRGLIWHTQGSGKSFTMLFIASKLKRSKIQDRQVLIVVDRTKLEDQMSNDMEELGLHSELADSIDDLNRLLKEDVNQAVLTTMQKFQDVDSDIKAEKEVDPVVMVDECHRFFEAQLGNKLLAALPDAFYFGLTGTPVVEGNDEKDRNTFREFSPEGEDYLHRYSIIEGQRDGVITDVAFIEKEGFQWEIPREKMDQDFEKEFSELDLQERNEILKEYVNQTQLAELRPRLEKVTEDIRNHYDAKLRNSKFKGMVVTPSRRAAALYGDEIRKYWPAEEVEVLISVDGNDPKLMQKYRKSDEEERTIIDKFKDSQKNPQLLIVCDKLLTGFDAPILKTMYLDKSMKNHNLLQAIARTNRPATGKPNGEIIDYQGVFEDRDRAFEYSEEYEVAENAAKDVEELEEQFVNLLDEMMEMFEDIEFDGSPEALQDSIVKLDKNSEIRSKFQSRYEEAEDLYESLMPNETLGKKQNSRRYEILGQIYYRYQQNEEGYDPGELSLRSQNVREKTRKILEKHVEVEGESESEEVSLEVPEPEVVRLEDQSPDYQATRRGPATVDDIAPLAQKNPAYESLSERVEDVLQQWRQDSISADEAIEEYEDAESAKKRLEEERKKRDLSRTEFAVFKLFDSSGAVDQEKAENIARETGDRLETLNLGVNYRQARKQVRKQLIYALKEAGEVELAKTDMLDKAVNYVLENKGYAAD